MSFQRDGPSSVRRERDALRAHVAEVESERDALRASLDSASEKLAEAREVEKENDYLWEWHNKLKQTRAAVFKALYFREPDDPSRNRKHREKVSTSYNLCTYRRFRGY